MLCDCGCCWLPVHCPCLFSCLSSLKWVNISITEGAQLWWPDTRHSQLRWATPGATFMGLTSFLNSPTNFALNTTSKFSVLRGQPKFSLIYGFDLDKGRFGLLTSAWQFSQYFIFLRKMHITLTRWIWYIRMNTDGFHPGGQPCMLMFQVERMLWKSVTLDDNITMG